MSKIRISFVGDIMPGGVLHYIKEHEHYYTGELSSSLNGDIKVGTLECAIGDEPHFDPEKMRRKQDIVYAMNGDLLKVKELGINVVALANNHIYDLGHDGLINTISQLDKLGIAHCGAGRNLTEASLPAVIKHEGKTYAFLSFCDYRDETVGYVPFATETSSGVNPLYPLNYSTSEVKKYKQIFDYVFVIPHWGIEHTWMVTSSVYEAARQLIKAGADGVIGGHTHRVQPVIAYKDKVIAFSLGNFLFPDRYLNKPRPTYYPNPNEDRSKFPITDGYPYVEEPTFKIWKKLGRIGMILNLEITENDTMRTDVVYTELSKQNVLGVASSDIVKEISKPLHCVYSLLMLGNSYKYVFNIKSCMGRVKNKIVSTLKKLR